MSGLAPYVELIVACGVVESVCRNVRVCGEQGWTDHEIVMSLVLLNLAGGDCVDDLDHLNADQGLARLLRWCANRSVARRVRREMAKRWRESKNRGVVSPSVARRYVGAFHNESEVDGKQVRTGREYAEVCFVPNAIAFGKNAPVYRYIATREALHDQVLPGMEPEQLSLPFQTIKCGGTTYKLFGVVTNMNWEADAVIRFHDGRRGKCEEAHKVLKEDFAGGKMPSSEFGANAAWWQIVVLAMNLASAMKRLVLGGAWAKRRMKAIRFLLINVPGRVVEKVRQLYVRLSADHPALELLVRMRLRIRELSSSPPVAV